MQIYFYGRVLSATDFSAEQEAAIHHGPSSAASSTPSDHHIGAPNETLLRSLPTSLLDPVALNPQPLPPKDHQGDNETKKRAHDELQHVRETPGERDSHIKDLEEKLNSVGDDAQLANTDLQNTLQKQQQTLQMMSNISKMLYDTATAVIRKIGG